MKKHGKQTKSEKKKKHIALSKLMCEARRRKRELEPEEEKPSTEEQLWLSCQTDVNKLVKRNGLDEDGFWTEEASDDVANTNKEVKKILHEWTEEASDDVANTNKEVKKILHEWTEEASDDVANTNKEVKKILHEWEIHKQLCRCCHAEGNFQGIAELEEDCSYDQMLLSCFNIQLFPVRAAGAGALRALCGLCAARLRDARAFRRQVLAAEGHFRELYNNNCIKVAAVDVINTEVKEELSGESDVADVDVINISDVEVKEDLSGESDDECNLQRNKQEQLVEPTVSKKKPKESYEHCSLFDDKYKCKRCDKKFKKLTTCEQHYKNKHFERRQYECTNCREKFIKMVDEAEPNECDNGELYSSICSACSEKIPLQGRLLREALLGNVKKHKPSREFLDFYTRVGDGFACKQCGKKYNKRESCRIHFKAVHLNRPMQKECNICKKRFASQRERILHKLNEHNVDVRHKCNACNQIYNTKKQLVNHEQNFHMLGVKHKCTHCEYECFSVEAMNKHKFKHKTVKEHHCKYCRKSFMRRKTLILHERIHTGDRRKVCAECGQAFVQKASLNYHMAKHHPEVRF